MYPLPRLSLGVSITQSILNSDCSQKKGLWGPTLSLLDGEHLLPAMEGRNYLADFSFEKLNKFLNLTLSKEAINGSNDTE